MARQNNKSKIEMAALERIKEARIAGQDTRHSRVTNLHAIQELVRGEPFYTFGIKGVERFNAEEVLEAISDITKCSNDINYTSGGGYISPESALKGIELGAKAIASVARRGGRFVLATGHPGALMLFYIELGRLIEEWGGELVQVERGAFVPPNFDLDYVEKVAVISDSCSIWHSHDTVPMEIILGNAGQVDLVVADHGFAGAAINAGIPVVGIIDTNDPALAVAKKMGANVIVIPMDDNRPLSSYLVVVDIIREFVNVTATPEAMKPAAGQTEKLRSSAEGRRRELQPMPEPGLLRAEAVVRRRIGPHQPMDEMVETFLEGFKEQFIQTHFDMEKDDDLVNDPRVSLAIYRQVSEAVQRFVARKMRELAPGITQGEGETLRRRSVSR